MNEHTPLKETNSSDRVRLQRHLEAHGESLDAVLRQIRADADVHESDILRAMIGSLEHRRDEAVRQRLRLLARELLNSFQESLVEVPGAYAGPEFDAALRWHAARLTDL